MTFIAPRTVSPLIIPSYSMRGLTFATLLTGAACSDRPLAPLGTNQNSVFRSSDVDGDGVPDLSDNCIFRYNPPVPGYDGTQPDSNGDGIGDACDATYCINNELNPDACADHLYCPSDETPLLPRAGVATFTSEGVIRISFEDPSRGVSAYAVERGSADPTDRLFLGTLPPASSRTQVIFEVAQTQREVLRYYVFPVQTRGRGEPCFGRFGRGNPGALEIDSPSR